MQKFYARDILKPLVIGIREWTNLELWLNYTKSEYVYFSMILESKEKVYGMNGNVINTIDFTLTEQYTGEIDINVKIECKLKSLDQKTQDLGVKTSIRPIKSKWNHEAATQELDNFINVIKSNKANKEDAETEKILICENSTRDNEQIPRLVKYKECIECIINTMINSINNEYEYEGKEEIMKREKEEEERRKKIGQSILRAKLGGIEDAKDEIAMMDEVNIKFYNILKAKPAPKTKNRYKIDLQDKIVITRNATYLTISAEPLLFLKETKYEQPHVPIINKYGEEFILTLNGIRNVKSIYNACMKPNPFNTQIEFKKEDICIIRPSEVSLDNETYLEKTLNGHNSNVIDKPPSHYRTMKRYSDFVSEENTEPKLTYEITKQEAELIAKNVNFTDFFERTKACLGNNPTSYYIIIKEDPYIAIMLARQDYMEVIGQMEIEKEDIENLKSMLEKQALYSIQ